MAELDELQARIKDLTIRAEEVGDDSHSPFTWEIKEEPFPHGFKIPQIPSYKRKNDPRDHLDAFNDHMDLLQVIDLAKCPCFTVTLTQVAKKWFHKLPANSIWSGPSSRMNSSDNSRPVESTLSLRVA